MDKNEIAIQEYRAQLSSADASQRLKAAYALAQANDFSGRDVLLDGLRSKDPDVRLHAAELLGHIGPSWAVDPLGALLDDEESYVRNEVIFALMNIERALVVPWLIKALGDSDEELLGDSVPTASEIGEDDEDEGERVSAWWREESWQFSPLTCYYRGSVVDLGAWIASLRNSSAPEIEWIIKRLERWTGEHFGVANDRDLADRWSIWWQTHSSAFKPGQRYFYGWLVNGDDSNLK